MTRWPEFPETPAQNFRNPHVSNLSSKALLFRLQPTEQSVSDVRTAQQTSRIETSSNFRPDHVSCGPQGGRTPLASQHHVERSLGVFVDHYNGHRPHRALGLVPPARYLRHGGSHPTLPPVSTVVIVSADCCASTHWRLERGDLRTPHDLCWSPLRRDTGASPSDMLFAICGVCRCRGLERKAARQLNSVRWINRPYRSTIPRWGMWNESDKNGIAPPNSSRWCTNLERPRIAGPSNE